MIHLSSWGFRVRPSLTAKLKVQAGMDLLDDPASESELVLL